MNREITKLYSNNDMVKVDCHDCNGCSSCCCDMGQSIWLDPYDVYNMTMHLGKNLEELLEKEIELHVEAGLILPNIRMSYGTTVAFDLDTSSMEQDVPKCGFLNEEGRCSIHDYRPGFCRLFPLGRNYEGDKLTYFVLEDACPAPNKTKVKINKWLNVPKLKDYESFLVKWHGLTKGLRAFYTDNGDNEAVIKAINMTFLQVFYVTPYEETDFYPQFEARMQRMRDFLRQLGIHL